MPESKYLQPNNKDRTVLFALAHIGGYMSFVHHADLIYAYSSKLDQIIAEYISQGKDIFVCPCRNQVELDFCMKIIKVKQSNPHIKLVFVTSTLCIMSQINNNIAMQAADAHRDDFNEFINLRDFWKSEDEFYMYLFRCASVLIGIYTEMEYITRKFCKLAKAANIPIINLYQKEKKDISAVLAETHLIFGGIPVSTVSLVNGSTKYQELIIQIQDLLSDISNSEDTLPKNLIGKIHQLERKYNELHQHISAYFFLAKFIA